MKSPEKHIEARKLTEIQSDVLDKLSYFSVFNHPLRASEVQNLLRHFYSYNRVVQALEFLEKQELCFAFDGYFLVHENVESCLKKRFEAEKNAISFLDKVPFFVRLMSKFPFVRGISISGSLSKGVMHAGGDIDYFIIAAHHKMWLTRMLLVIFKKTVLFNSHKFFCVNYFISENQLQIPDENIFTATEITTLIPVFGHEKVKLFFAANKWVSRYYGHFEHPIKIPEGQKKKFYLKSMLEFLLDNKFGNALDKACMYLTVWRWDVKFQHFDREKYNLTMRSTRDVSKHHPQDFQTTVLARFEAIKTQALQKLIPHS